MSTRWPRAATTQGLTFGFGDEIEAGLRALAQADPAAYRREVQRIRREQAAYDKAYPLDTLGWEVAGGIGTALIPGVDAGCILPKSAERKFPSLR